MGPLRAILYRESKIRATNTAFLFWDLCYPMFYLLVFGVGVNAALGAPALGANINYDSFFLAGVLGMASFGIAANSSWSFFLDRDNGIFYEMLTYPMRRSQYLLGKVLFNVCIGIVQAMVTIAGRMPVAENSFAMAFAAFACGGRDWRDGGLVFLLHDFRVEHPAQRYFQQRDVGFLFRVFVRQFDVLSACAVAAMVSHHGARKSDHVAGGLAALWVNWVGCATANPD